MKRLNPLEALTREALQPSTARAEIVRRLTDAIRTGLLQPGTPIRQQQVAEHYSVSRMPVREAIRQLEAQGLLISDANKGARVADAVVMPGGISVPELQSRVQQLTRLVTEAITLAETNGLMISAGYFREQLHQVLQGESHEQA